MPTKKVEALYEGDRRIDALYDRLNAEIQNYLEAHGETTAVAIIGTIEKLKHDLLTQYFD